MLPPLQQFQTFTMISCVFLNSFNLFWVLWLFWFSWFAKFSLVYPMILFRCQNTFFLYSFSNQLSPFHKMDVQYSILKTGHVRKSIFMWIESMGYQHFWLSNICPTLSWITKMTHLLNNRSSIRQAMFIIYNFHKLHYKGEEGETWKDKLPKTS